MVAPGAKKPKARHDAAALLARHEALTQVEEKFRDFDVVWAKVHGFPWWPGVLFHSWDVVRRAGIRTDPKIVASLPVPPPEKVPILDAATGQETGIFRVRRHCLVMFLDKFNFSLVEIAPVNVASFTAHYQVYEHAVMGTKNKKKTEFRRALLKAAQLLHIGKKFDEDDLVMLEEPSPAEKKQRMEEVMGVEEVGEEEGSASLDDAWDDREKADDADFSLEVEEAAHEKKPEGKRKPSSRKRKAEVKKVEDDDVVILTPAKPRRKAPAKDSKHRARKPSRKETQSAAHVAVVSPSPSPIDLTGTPESEAKKPHKDTFRGNSSGKPPRVRKKKVDGDAAGKRSKSKKRGHAAVLVLEDDDVEYQPSTEEDGFSELVSDGVEDVTREEKQRSLVLTPLASIWTTPASDNESPGAGAHAQLAYKQAFVWDDAVFTDDLSIAEKELAEAERKQAKDALAHAGPGRDRSMGKRQSRSVQQSHIRQNLMSGNLDPHTMVQCAAYRPKDFVEDPNSRSRGGPTLDPPFQVVVHPDAVFVADLHAHLATCEIIGFLGGKWDEASNTLYIQAAFPCRSLVIDGDDGSTDVEMDPGSEIELRGIIENAQLEVVGWYHSHPAFAPDPSVRDIENQTSYQQLFQRSSKGGKGAKTPTEPFVGLIVGTYDTRRSTPVSLFRYFHTRGEKVSGGACREIYMPYEFIPGRRHFRSVLQDEERARTRLFPMYESVLRHFKLELSYVKQQLPVDITATTPRKATSRSPPARVRAHGPIRKRKQSSESAGDKPMKKTKATSRRSTRSSTNHVDLTGGDDTQKSQLSENGAGPAVETAVGENGDTAGAAAVETTSSNGHTSQAKEDVKAAPSSNAVVISPEVDRTEVARVVAGVVESAEVAIISSEAEQKSLAPKPLQKSASSSSGDESKQLSTDDSLGKREDGKSRGALAIQVDVGVAGAKSSSASSAAKRSVSPATGNGSSGRKRNRKPKKTTKNSNRSASPVSDGPSPHMSPSPSSAPPQTFYTVFQPSGPRISNGGTPEEVPQLVARADDLKADNMLVEDDMKYISINLTDDWTAEDKTGKGDKGVQKSTSGGLIIQEVGKYVNALVEQVLDAVANVDSKKTAQGGKEAGFSPYKPSSIGNGMENGPSKPELSGPASRSTAGNEPRLFGSNGECEDIRTSLEKMDKYLDKLKAMQVLKSRKDNAAPENEVRPEAEEEEESKREAEEAEPKREGSSTEQDHLIALRTKYGAGVSGCAEQVITLVDYYRDFERRTDLSEIWKSRITKLEKIESSLSEYVQFLNIPAALRHDFIKDLISYLRESWASKDRRR